MTAIIHATLVMRDHYIPDAVLLIEDGLIKAFGPAKSLPIPESCDIIDAKRLYVGPGFVDIHTHSDGKVFFQDDPVTASQHHLKHGTTSLLPALYTSMNTYQYVQSVAVLRQAMNRPECANIAGLYMEGPYLNPGFGCDRTSNPWANGVVKSAYQPVIESAWDLARVWCIAPEREDIMNFVRDVKAKNPNAVFAVAHSAASPQEIEALIPYGLKIGTHHTNATGDRPKYPECRGVCVDEAVNYNREIYAELICDSMGIHVDPYMLRLVRKIKGEDRIILISDAYACDGPVPPGYDGVDDINFDWEGEIAGSKMTLDIACRNMMKHTGASVVDVFRYASYNPSRAVGLLDRGEIAVGLRADLVICDHQMNIQSVILKGEYVK
ncbi:MAG: amidohydrolase family protein [Oscillospiraceae bacterium]|nr:amidohydrolase family protein [Oscillospiraceae bacterium]